MRAKIKNIRINSIQLVLFSPFLLITDKLKIAIDIRNRLVNILDGEPIMLPVPEEAPPEFPRIQLTSKNGIYNIIISKNRIDFFAKYGLLENIIDIPVDLSEYIITTFEYLKDSIQAQIIRAGNVTEWFIELDEFSSAEYILSKYIKENIPISEPKEFELHWLTKEYMSNFEINKWTRIVTTHKTLTSAESNIISLIIDINSLSEKAYNFNKNLLQKFFSESFRL